MPQTDHARERRSCSTGAHERRPFQLLHPWQPRLRSRLSPRTPRQERASVVMISCSAPALGGSWGEQTGKRRVTTSDGPGLRPSVSHPPAPTEAQRRFSFRCSHRRQLHRMRRGDTCPGGGLGTVWKPSRQGCWPRKYGSGLVGGHLRVSLHRAIELRRRPGVASDAKFSRQMR